MPRNKVLVNAQKHILPQGEKPTESEMANFFSSLSKCKAKPVVLSVVSVFSEKYITKSSLVTFPKLLNTLYQSDFLQLNYDELLNSVNQLWLTLLRKWQMLLNRKPELKISRNFGLSKGLVE